jgi:hypothetical protein
MGEKELSEYCRDVPANTDNYPVLEFSKTVNLAPDTSSLQFIYNMPDNYQIIDFDTMFNDSVKNSILKKTESFSLNRKRIIKETIESVKFQVREYKITGKAPKF